ncbi:MAG: histidine phosphatase family protein [Verrucomicrobiota bacterium]
MEKFTRLYLIRHGEVEERYHRVFGGRIDMELSPRGHAQAKVLAEYLHGTHLDALYASPMKRAQQTLAPLAEKYPHHTPRAMHDLREIDFGVWTGLSWDQVREKFGISAFDWLEQLEKAAIPEAESARQFQARVEPCLHQLLKEHPGESVAVVCHGGVIRMLLSLLLEVPVTKMARLQIEYGSLTVVEHHPRKTEVELLNFTPWRDHKKTIP